MIRCHCMNCLNRKILLIKEIMKHLLLDNSLKSSSNKNATNYEETQELIQNLT